MPEMLKLVDDSVSEFSININGGMIRQLIKTN